MKNLSLKAKLFLVLGILSIVAVAIAFVGITRLGDLNGSLREIVDVTSTKQLCGNQIRASLLAMHRAEKNLILAMTEEEMNKHIESMKNFSKKLEEQRARLAGLMSGDERRQLEEFDKAYAAFKDVQAKVSVVGQKNTKQHAFELSRGTGRDLFERGEKLIRVLAERNEKQVNDVVAGLKAASNSDEMKNKLTSVDDAATRAVLANQVIAGFITLQRIEKNLILETTEEGMQKYAKDLQDRQADLTARLGELEKISTEQGKKEIAEFRTVVANWLDNNRQVTSLSLENSNEIAQRLSSTEGRAAIDKAEEVLNQISRQADDDMNAAAKAAEQLYATARVLMLGVSAGGILVATILGYCIIVAVIASIKNIFRGLRTLSTAELQQTQEAFSRIIDGMEDGVAQVNDAAAQVASASQALAGGASEQASSLEETSSALEEMAAMTQTNAANAKQANDVSTETSRAAERGDNTMKAINESSDQISKIIKVIEEIAFQTNLLALNAAVEAARAGEHGKGFAVVADEVRNLAQRAAQAARETTGLIENSVNKSKEGMEAVGAIVDGVNKVTSLLAGIATASQQQAQGVEQVNVAVSQMDKVTQQNASASEESASAAEELSSQAEATKALVEELVRMVRGSDSGGAGTRRPSTSRSRKPAASTHHLEHKSKAVNAASARADSTKDAEPAEEFMSLESGSRMKDF
jgi:methyl-accepting chemotaxis protein